MFDEQSSIYGTLQTPRLEGARLDIGHLDSVEAYMAREEVGSKRGDSSLLG